MLSYAAIRRCVRSFPLSLFDVTLFNACVLCKNITSQKLNYNWFRLVVAEELLGGLIMQD